MSNVYYPGCQTGDMSNAPLQFPAGHFDRQGAMASFNAESKWSSRIDKNDVVDSHNSLAAILMHRHAPGCLHAYEKVIVRVLAQTMRCPFDRACSALEEREA